MTFCQAEVSEYLATSSPRSPATLIALLAVVPHRQSRTEIHLGVVEIVAGIEDSFCLKPATWVVLVLSAPVSIDLHQPTTSAIGVSSVE